MRTACLASKKMGVMPIGSIFFVSVSTCWQHQVEVVVTDLCGIQKLFAIIALGSLRHWLSLDRSNGRNRLSHGRHFHLDVPCCCAICLQAIQDMDLTSEADKRSNVCGCASCIRPQTGVHSQLVPCQAQDSDFAMHSVARAAAVVCNKALNIAASERTGYATP